MHQLYVSYMFYTVMCNLVFYDMLIGVFTKVHTSWNLPIGNKITETNTETKLSAFGKSALTTVYWEVFH